MKIREAFKALNSLTELKDCHKHKIDGNLQHSNFEHHISIIKSLNKEINTLTKCIYNTEMDDSYVPNPDLVIWRDE